MENLLYICIRKLNNTYVMTDKELLEQGLEIIRKTENVGIIENMVTKFIIGLVLDPTHENEYITLVLESQKKLTTLVDTHPLLEMDIVNDLEMVKTFMLISIVTGTMKTISEKINEPQLMSICLN